jgi:S-adenosylmethionine hydrolase
VIARIASDVRVLDITHEVDAHDVRRGGTILAQTVGYLPPAVHLAVVDPGVGSSRRPVVVLAGSCALVGPDNGLLLPAADALGGVSAAYELVEPRYRLPDVSMTFHGRDIFAPAAAHLATGVTAEEFGPKIPTDDLVRLPAPVTVVAGGRLTSEIVSVDRFGNMQLAARRDELTALGLGHGQPVRVQLRRSVVDGRLGATFADVPGGSLLVHVDSAGHVAIAVNGGSAAEALGGHVGEIVISPIG